MSMKMLLTKTTCYVSGSTTEIGGEAKLAQTLSKNIKTKYGCICFVFILHIRARKGPDDGSMGRTSQRCFRPNEVSLACDLFHVMLESVISAAILNCSGIKRTMLLANADDIDTVGLKPRDVRINSG